MNEAKITFTDIIRKAGINPAEVKMIRHALTDANFKACYDKGMVYEYTCHQKKDFSHGYKYWAIFVGEFGTTARFFGLYLVKGHVNDLEVQMPEGLPLSESTNYTGKYDFLILKK